MTGEVIGFVSQSALTRTLTEAHSLPVVGLFFPQFPHNVVFMKLDPETPVGLAGSRAGNLMNSALSVLGGEIKADTHRFCSMSG